MGTDQKIAVLSEPSLLNEEAVTKWTDVYRAVVEFLATDNREYPFASVFEARLERILDLQEICRDLEAPPEVNEVNRLGVKPRGFPFQRRDLQTHAENQVCP